MSYPVTTLIVPVEGPIRTEVIDSPEKALDAFQKLVEGYIEPIDLPTGDTALINEEGKLKNLPMNPRATEALQGHLFAGDYISGDLVVVGSADAAGEFTSANLETAQEMFGPIG